MQFLPMGNVLYTMDEGVGGGGQHCPCEMMTWDLSSIPGDCHHMALKGASYVQG